MVFKKNRSMKVYSQSGYRYKETLAIMLKGQWLRDLGFDIGDYISVSCENGKLVITPMHNGQLWLKQRHRSWRRKRRSYRSVLNWRRQGCMHSLWQSRA